MKRFAVLGNPVSHSKSPAIHQQFAKQCGLTIGYDAIEINKGEFAAEVAKLFDHGLTGANVTMPFKGDAFEFADVLTPRAQLAQAVNTLWRSKDGVIHGDTTDGVGLVCAIEQLQGFDIAGRSILVLGAGGAVRGVVQPLLDAGASSITIANRTVEKAEQIAADFARVKAISLANVTAGYDLIINGTSVSLTGASLPVTTEQIRGAQLLVDMTYGSAPTPLMLLANDQQIEAIDGLGMLLGQAAESFNIWHEIRPDIKQCLDVISHTLR